MRNEYKIDMRRKRENERRRKGGGMGGAGANMHMTHWKKRPSPTSKRLVGIKNVPKKMAATPIARKPPHWGMDEPAPI